MKDQKERVLFLNIINNTDLLTRRRWPRRNIIQTLIHIDSSFTHPFRRAHGGSPTTMFLSVLETHHVTWCLPQEGKGKSCTEEMNSFQPERNDPIICLHGYDYQKLYTSPLKYFQSGQSVPLSVWAAQFFIYFFFLFLESRVISIALKISFARGPLSHCGVLEGTICSFN